jgi:Raf kinase inhibitor-like YbhB/YbcL family protein
MNVKSSTFTDGGTIPDSMVYDQFGLSGGNRSPQLSFDGVPDGTKSFAVVCHDPDAPTSGGFSHWVMFNIPGNIRALDENAGTKEPAAALGATLGHTDYGETQYGGPCPPPGPAHHYNFTVFALDAESLPLTSTATLALLEFFAGQHTLAKAKITGTFARPAGS